LVAARICADVKWITFAPPAHVLVVDHETAADNWAAIAIELDIVNAVLSLVDFLSSY